MIQDKKIKSSLLVLTMPMGVCTCSKKSNASETSDNESEESAVPDAWVLSVCVPDTYAVGIDTNGDSSVDVTEAVKGSLVINYDAEITSTNGGQEDHVFGSSTAYARHRSKYVLKVFE